MRMRNRHAVAVAVGAIALLPATATAVTRSQPTGPAAAKPYLDSRAGDRSQAARAGSTVAAARPSARTRQARTELRRDLGRQGVLSIDPLTGTPRQLLRTDGALSSPRAGDRAEIALDFVRANREALGLDAADLDGLSAQRRTSTPRGLTVVRFRQLYRGIPAFDNDLRVAIDRAGRVHSLAGSPRPDLGVASIEPSLSGAEALARLQKNVGVERSLPVTSGPTGARRTTTFKGGDFARLVLFGAADGATLAWHVTYRATSTAWYAAVVDAASGAVLYRSNMVKAAANASVYPNHPGDGAAETVDLEDYGLPAGSTVLDGNWSKQWADVDDDDFADAAERTGPSGGADFVYPFTAFTPGAACPATEPCAWNPAVRNSWQTNRDQNAVQAFYLVSRFHDHLAGAQVAFTDGSGNFEVGGTGGNDPVLTQTDDGADTEDDGGPDISHSNNANMGTPPDGQSPTSISPGVPRRSSLRPSRTWRSDAYQSLQASPIAPACAVLRAPTPSASMTRRLDSPCVYSCHTTPESSPPLMLRKSAASGEPEFSNRYICIVGGSPSGGVLMFALFEWLASGPPSPSVSAPSSVCVSTGSSPPVPPTSKLPDSSVKATSSPARWSWKRETR